MVEPVLPSWHVGKMLAQKEGIFEPAFLGVLVCNGCQSPRASLGWRWAQGGGGERCRVKLTAADKVVTKKTWRTGTQSDTLFAYSFALGNVGGGGEATPPVPNNFF